MKQTTKERARKVALVGLAMQATGDLILSLGTIFAAYQGTKAFLTGIMHGWPLGIACTIVAILAYYMLDHGKKTVFPATIAWVIGKKDKETASERMPIIFHLVTAVLSVLMLGGSYFSNVVITPDIAATAANTDDNEPNQYGEMVEGTTSLYVADRKAYDQDVEAAQATLSEIEAKQDQARATVERANPGLVSALLTSKEWAEKELRQKERTERQRYERDRKRAQKVLDEAKEARAAFIASRGGETSGTLSKLATLVELEEKKGEAKLDRWSTWTNMLMLIGLLSFIFGTITVVSFEDTTNEIITPEIDLPTAIGGKFGGLIDWATRTIHGSGKKNSNNLQFAMTGASQPPTPSIPTTASVAAAAASFLSAKQVTENLRQKSDEAGHCLGGVCDLPDRKTDRDRQTETETEKQTESQTDTDRTQKTTEQTDGVGVGQYPDPSDGEAMKGYIKRLRATHTYAKQSGGDLNAPKIKDGLAFLERSGYSVTHRADGGLTIAKYKSERNTDGAIIHEWDVENEQ